MKTVTLCSLIMLGAFLTNCSDNIRVKSDYDRKTNFAQYTSYSWLAIEDIERKNNPLIYNELSDKRIKAAVDKLLPAKGISFTPTNPKLKIHYHIVIEDRTVIRPDMYGSYSSPY